MSFYMHSYIFPKLHLWCCLHLLFCCAAANGITSTVESLQFNFATIEAATNNFSNDNKLGEGGFGAVYKINY
jgi:hypothetical protein